ncbi:hypothetical protein MOSE0_B02058 [Monosporozyma servazzii]
MSAPYPHPTHTLPKQKLKNTRRISEKYQKNIIAIPQPYPTHNPTIPLSISRSNPAPNNIYKINNTKSISPIITESISLPHALSELYRQSYPNNYPGHCITITICILTPQLYSQPCT